MFEHLTNPLQTLFLLMSKLNKDGIICGTTNFYLGDGIEDSNDPGYMSHKGHVAYWSLKSMKTAVQKYDPQYNVILFEMVRPGSVLPDEMYNQLWPNKRVFFIYPSNEYKRFFTELKNETSILPIDKP